ncbi:HMG high mobility group box-containing protein [Nitzschia inconspicua]|uniref:HMG high mobility group box-containing protein n=1 Tax=Nitzschia inconspicua TaxID=303405 RepID=A0A9K3L1M0_9STRA|nr:HMG high mobility group box-containing protein [Nitzschia inconspicua]
MEEATTNDPKIADDEPDTGDDEDGQKHSNRTSPIGEDYTDGKDSHQEANQADSSGEDINDHVADESNDDDNNGIISDNDLNDDKRKAAALAALPPRPVKRSRTAYFIFVDENRAKIQSEHPGEGVAFIARKLGQQWAQIAQQEKEVYQQKAAKEREQVAAQLEEYNKALQKAGLQVEDLIDYDGKTKKNNGPKDPLEMVFPVARIRKIAKLDPEVKNLSKEALQLVVKCAELFTAKLGQETTGVARMQNRRTLLPQDVAHVCRHRDPFLFLKDDIQDLVVAQQQHAKDQQQEDENAEGATTSKAPSKKDALREAAASGSKPLTAYFGAPNN